jgi:glycerol uptake facilitator protein
MASPVLGEFLGTMVLILMGNGVVASVLLKDSKANNAGWIVITAGWAFAVMSGVYTSIAAGSADAHLNPAVSLGFAIISGDYSKLGTYIPAQLAGAFVGASLVWLHFFPHWAVTEDSGLKLACFSTGPAIRNPLWNLISEIIGTFVLMLVVFSIFCKAVSAGGPAPALGPPLVGGLVWGLGLSLGGTTGYAINPARDLGPRLAHAILPIAGKGDSDWGYAAIPVIGPMLGAALAALLVSGLHLG